MAVQFRGFSIGDRDEMVTNAVFVPPGVVPTFVVAAIETFAGLRKRLLGTENRIRGAVGEVGQASLAADAVNNGSLTTCGVALVDPGAFVRNRR